MRLLTAIAGSILGGAALAATTCLVGIPDLEQGPVAGSDAAAAGSSAAGGSGGSDGGAGGLDAGGAGGTLPTYREVVLGDAPLAYWRLGEAAGGMAHDEMPQENHGVYRQVELGADGAIGDDDDTAARFHAESSLLIDDPDHLLLFTVDTAFSIEGWFLPEHQDQRDRRLLSSEPQLSDPARGYGLIASDGEVRFFRARDGGVESIGGGSVPLLQFAHIVGTYDGQQMCLYVNSSLVGSCSYSNVYLSSFWRELGVGMPATGGNDNVHFIGVADELAVYAEALTPSQIEAHYQAGTR